MKETVLKSLPDVSITDKKGRTKSFEISVNGTIVFSKLDNGDFPDFNDIVEKINGQSFSNGEKPVVKTEAADGSEPSTSAATNGVKDEKKGIKKAIKKEPVVKKEPTKRKAESVGTTRVTRSRK